MLDHLRRLLPTGTADAAAPAHGAWIADLAGARTADVTAALREHAGDDLRAGGLWLYAHLEKYAQHHGDIRRVFLWNTTAADLLTALARRKLGWTPQETQQLWTLLAERLDDDRWQMTLPPVLRLPLAAAEELDPADRTPLLPMIRTLADQLDRRGPELFYDPAERARFSRRLHALLPTPSAGPGEDGLALDPTILGGGDDFGPAARAALEASHETAVVVPLLRHLAGYTGGVTPNKKWRAQLVTLLAEEPAGADVARLLLERVCVHRDSPATLHRYGHAFVEQVFVTPETATLLRAAVWAAAVADAPWAPTLLGRAAVWCGGGLGGAAGTPRCAQVTSSAVAALGDLGGDSAVAELSRCAAKLRNKTLLKSVDKTLHAVAARAGLTPGQLLERSVPTLGLDAGGRTERHVGEYVVEIVLDVTGARLAWRNASGRVVKTISKQVRDQHADTLAELRTTVKEAGKLLGTERARLEGLLGTDRTWDVDDWVRYYLAHPVTGTLAETLLWQVGGDDGTWVTGLPVTDDGRWALQTVDGAVAPVGEHSRVRLWHPIRATAADVAAWREELTRRELRQPFKQAFREVYLLTPAEEVTDTYSNRFAGHILRYRQAGALIRARGWSGNHLGYWDGGFEGEATREIGEDGWRARFYYDLVEDAADDYETPGMAASDQVRFERRSGEGPHPVWEAARMVDVPPLVFTEAMRDVDLFVGVSSIAADPEWVDGGETRHRDYWYRTSFGDLTESAQMRREALTRLMPRTKIGDRVRVTEKFLEVDGALHTYKIHLGSGNILMSPNDAYLCIVAGRGAGAGGRVFLPFEENGGLLSVIVSKAFLLADDATITDPSITRQLHAR